MALKTVIELVKNRLPFLPTDTSLDEKIEDFKLEQYYFLQKWTKIEDVNVESDASYTGTLRILVAELTTYNMLVRKVLENMGGVNGEAASSGKHLKSGKADVVEAEFEYAKATDGNELLVKTDSLISELKVSICNYAYSLGYPLPMCGQKKNVPPPFVAYVKDDYGNLT